MWPKQVVELLIHKYKEHENLYNVAHPHYVDRVKRSISIFAIRKELNKLDPSITEAEIKKKIHALRSQYTKELREIENSLETDEIYEPKLWCFEQLEYLRKHCGPRKLDKFPPKEPAETKKAVLKQRKILEEKEDMANFVVDAFEESGNDLSVLAQGWSAQYAELSRQQKVYARKIISDVLFHGCLDNLRESTVQQIHNIFESGQEKKNDPLHSDE